MSAEPAADNEPTRQPSSNKPIYLEKYFDTTYQRDYYYNPATGDSLWEAPTDAVIADMTIIA